MKHLKQIITAAVSAAVISSNMCAAAAVRTDLTSENAAAGAMVISTDMIYETQNDVTKNQLAATLFNYTDMADDSVRTERNAYNSDFTLYFGEEDAVNLSVFRAYVYGSDDDERNPSITVYGSNDGASWIAIGAIEEPVAAAWNETSIDSTDAYSYIKVESETTENEEETVDDEGNLTSENTRIFHQRITKAVFITASDTEEEESTGSVSSGTGTVTEGTTQFTDIGGHWAEATIKEYTGRGILSGYPDGTFRPDNGVSAAEFCRIVSAVQGINYKISGGSWSLPYIREMMAAGVIERGDYDDYDAKMTREQVAKAVVPLMAGEYYPKDLTQFGQYISDFGEVSNSHGENVIKTYILGVMSGYEDGTWRPQSEVTRAEILSILDRVFNKDLRSLPEALQGASTESPEQSYYYTAAVQVRRNTSANNMQYRLYGSNSVYMEEDDVSTGLKLFNEVQGAQGFGMVLRYDVSDIKAKRDKLQRLYLDVTWSKGGTAGNALGLWYYSYEADKTDWNNNLYYKNNNGSAVAGDDISGYNSVISNINASLPSWGDTSAAVPDAEKTKPLASAARSDDGKYIIELTDIADDLIAHAREDGTVELILTTVNYDDYGQEDDKPQIYLAGEKAPRLNAEYDTQGGAIGDIDYSGVSIDLKPADATLSGAMIIETVDGIENIAYFVHDQQIDFEFEAPVAGEYMMKLNYSASDSAGGTVGFKINDEYFEHDFPSGNGWTEYGFTDVKTVNLKQGKNTLTINDVKLNATYLINIRDVVFEKI